MAGSDALKKIWFGWAIAGPLFVTVIGELYKPFKHMGKVSSRVLYRSFMSGCFVLLFGSPLHILPCFDFVLWPYSPTHHMMRTMIIRSNFESPHHI
jgi:hypothetical protein